MPERRTVGQCVYLLAVPSGHVKIGVARNPAARARDLQTGNPEPITFVGATLLGAAGKSATAFEKALHKALCPHRTVGEWFSLSVAEALEWWARVWDSLPDDAEEQSAGNKKRGRSEERRAYMRDYMRRKRAANA